MKQRLVTAIILSALACAPVLAQQQSSDPVLQRRPADPNSPSTPVNAPNQQAAPAQPSPQTQQPAQTTPQYPQQQQYPAPPPQYPQTQQYPPPYQPAYAPNVIPNG